jgi:hypothetical protein
LTSSTLPGDLETLLVSQACERRQGQQGAILTLTSLLTRTAVSMAASKQQDSAIKPASQQEEWTQQERQIHHLQKENALESSLFRTACYECSHQHPLDPINTHGSTNACSSSVLTRYNRRSRVIIKQYTTCLLRVYEFKCI